MVLSVLNILNQNIECDQLSQRAEQEAAEDRTTFSDIFFVVVVQIVSVLQVSLLFLFCFNV